MNNLLKMKMKSVVASFASEQVVLKSNVVVHRTFSLFVFPSIFGATVDLFSLGIHGSKMFCQIHETDAFAGSVKYLEPTI